MRKLGSVRFDDDKVEVLLDHKDHIQSWLVINDDDDKAFEIPVELGIDTTRMSNVLSTIIRED